MMLDRTPAYRSLSPLMRPWTKQSGGSNAVTRPLNHGAHYQRQPNLIIHLMHTYVNHMVAMTQIPVQMTMVRERNIY